MITNTFSKAILAFSLLMLCVIIVGGSPETKITPKIETVVQHDSAILQKIETKLKEYELTKKP